MLPKLEANVNFLSFWRFIRISGPFIFLCVIIFREKHMHSSKMNSGIKKDSCSLEDASVYLDTFDGELSILKYLIGHALVFGCTCPYLGFLIVHQWVSIFLVCFMFNSTTFSISISPFLFLIVFLNLMVL